MSHRLFHRFQGPLGHYNGFAAPFTEYFRQQNYKGEKFCYFAALYPVINYDFEFDYESRKRSEKIVSVIQRQDTTAYPTISRWRYSRKFDATSEISLQPPSEQGFSSAGVQSARGLFEYSCGELDTLALDLRQASLLEESHSDSSSRCLLQVDPMWLIVFPDSGKRT